MENLKGKAGIYKIENIVNKKVYVGSSICLDRRRDNHFIMLRNGNHDNSYLQRAYNKYGDDKFEFIVLEFVEKIQDKKKLKQIILTREQFWIDKLNASKRSSGYNLAPFAHSRLGYIMSDETKQKLRIANTGKKRSEETKVKIGNSSRGDKNFWYGKTYGDFHKAKKVINLTTGKIYDSIKRASEDCGSNCYTNISSVCRGETKSAYGFLWAYLDENNKPIETNYNKVGSHSIINLDTGDIFESIVAASLAYNIRASAISNNLLGLSKTCGGYRWKYLDKNIEFVKEIKVINLDTNKTFKCIADAARFYKICARSLNSACKRKNNIYGGYHWQYYEDYLKDQEKEK